MKTTLDLSAHIAAVVLALAAATCHAEPTPEATARPEAPAASGYVEAGLGHAQLSAGNADWNDQYLRAYGQIDPANGVNIEISRQSHFGDHGTFVGAGLSHEFNSDWYGSISAGTSEGGTLFLPKVRLDTFLNRKWLERKNLVTSLGLGYYHAKDQHFDRTLLLGAAWYFEAPWIVETGVRLNQGNPGDVHANRGFAAVTWGSNGHHYLTLRHEAGREAYQVIGPAATISDFSSRETTLIWRQWITSDMGFNLRAARYVNPSYKRNGIEAGLFLSF